MSPDPASVRRPKPRPYARIGLLLLATLLTEVVVIGVVGCQYVANRLARVHAVPGHYRLGDGLRGAVLTFAWRYSWPVHDPYHLSLGAVLLDGSVVVLSLVFVAALLRGPITFWRAFLGSWLAVVVATMLGALVRGSVVSYPYLPGADRVTDALFGSSGPSVFAFWAGVGLGFVVALVLTTVALATRRIRPVDQPDPDASDGGSGGTLGYDAEPPEPFFGPTQTLPRVTPTGAQPVASPYAPDGPAWAQPAAPHPPGSPAWARPAPAPEEAAAPVRSPYQPDEATRRLQPVRPAGGEDGERPTQTLPTVQDAPAPVPAAQAPTPQAPTPQAPTPQAPTPEDATTAAPATVVPATTAPDDTADAAEHTVRFPRPPDDEDVHVDEH